MSDSSAQDCPEFVGSSPRARLVREQIREIAPASDPVLISGETGTGKEIVATLLHRQSERPGRFVPFNCANLNEGTADSELFGSCRGAFTGAIERSGLFHDAKGGTLFLDEVGELPAQIQTKLLRALQDGCIRRVGGREERVAARVVAATNQELESGVSDGRFRVELLHRFTFTIELPTLRERPEDIPELVEHFLLRERTFPGRNAAATGLSEDAMSALRDRWWMGNVRELVQVIRRALTKTRGAEKSVLEICDLDLKPERRIPSVDRAAATMIAVADEIIEQLQQDRRPRSIPSIEDEYSQLALGRCLAERFLSRSWPDPSAAARTLFGYNDVDSVRAVIRRRRPSPPG